jgi:hypothetical protein
MRNIEEHDPQTWTLIMAAGEIHCPLGHGFLEAVYPEAALQACNMNASPGVMKI